MFLEIPIDVEVCSVDILVIVVIMLRLSDINKSEILRLIKVHVAI